MIRRSPIALVQVKAGNTIKNLLNEMSSLHQAKEVTQHNEFNKDTIQKMDTIFMNSKSKMSDPHRLILKLSDKINLKI